MWQRGTALVPDVARVAQLTGATDLSNLESTGELRLADLLVSASDAIYDRLLVEGVVPHAADPRRFERAVAFQFLGLLAAQGHVFGEGETSEIATLRFLELSERYYDQVRDQRDDAGSLRRVGVPQVRNVVGGPFDR